MLNTAPAIGSPIQSQAGAATRGTIGSFAEALFLPLRAGLAFLKEGMPGAKRPLMPAPPRAGRAAAASPRPLVADRSRVSDSEQVLTGVLRTSAHGLYALYVDDGGTWQLDIGLRFKARRLVGQRVAVIGTRSGFDLLDVRRIATA